MNGKTAFRVLRTVAIGAVGGVAADLVGIPLPYLFGALAVTAALNFAGVEPTQPPRSVRIGTRVVIGVLVGSSVEPEFFTRLTEIGASAVLVPVQVVGVTLASAYFLRRLSDMSFGECLICGLPGGIFTIVAAVESAGHNVQRVGLLHTIRVAFVVMVIPPVLIWGIAPESSGPTIMLRLAEIPMLEIGTFVLLAIVGTGLARILRFPGADVMLPMFLAFAAQFAGAGNTRPPAELVLLAQLILGVGIGAGFRGGTAKMFGHWILLGVGVTAISMAGTVLSAWILQLAVGLPWSFGLLAFAPGGLPEMSVAALALGMDVGFVASIQIWRVLLIFSVFPLLLRKMGRDEERMKDFPTK